MYALEVSFLAFALIFSGALAGMVIRRRLPPDHLAPEARDSVRLAIGLVVTMTGLVLGMLVSSAKTFYDGEKNQVAQLASQIVLLGDLLKAYGPETKPVRVEALKFVEEGISRVWPRERSQMYQLRPESTAGAYFYAQVQQLTPKDDMQRTVKAELLSAAVRLRQNNWLLYLQSEQTSVPMPLLGVVISWLVAIFVSFGLFAPRNATVMVTLIVCALAASLAIFIILSMYSPFHGFLKISPVSADTALSQIAKDQ
jgi:hypothetical protein